MRVLVVALAMLMTTAPADVVCRIGTTQVGGMADLATIQAVHERQAAESAGQAFTGGAPTVAPWVGLVRCSSGA